MGRTPLNGSDPSGSDDNFAPVAHDKKLFFFWGGGERDQVLKGAKACGAE